MSESRFCIRGHDTFAPEGRNKYGQCRECRRYRSRVENMTPQQVARQNERFRLSRLANLDRFNENQRRYKASDKGRASATRTLASQTKEYRLAHAAIANGIRDGRVAPQACEVCGADKAHAHHYLGYGVKHRLDVRWLCPTHHSEAHRVAA